jgi:hypothetical protein
MSWVSRYENMIGKSSEHDGSYASKIALFVASRPAFSNNDTSLPPVPFAGALAARVAAAERAAPRMKGQTGADFAMDTI